MATNQTTKSYAEVDRTLGPVLDVHLSYVLKYKELDGRLKAAEGDRNAALQAWIESSDDAAAVKLREQMKQITAKLCELAEKRVPEEKLDDGEREKLTTELNELKSNIREGAAGIRNIVGSMAASLNKDAVLKALEEIGDPTKSGRGRKPGTAGSSLPKPSANFTVRKADGTGNAWTFDSYGKAAKFLKMDTESFQKEAAKAAGVPHEEISSVEKPFSFTAQLDGVAYKVDGQPFKRGKSGPVVNTEQPQKSEEGQAA